MQKNKTLVGRIYVEWLLDGFIPVELLLIPTRSETRDDPRFLHAEDFGAKYIMRVEGEYNSDDAERCRRLAWGWLGERSPLAIEFRDETILGETVTA